MSAGSFHEIGPPHAGPDPRIRWVILFLIVLATSINYVDRQVLSVLAPVLRREFGWTNTGYSLVVFAFMLGWAVGEVPLGVFIDRVGPRRGYQIIVSCWSLVMVLHAAARSLAAFVGLRFLLGFGECGNWSAGLKVISQWFPEQERGRAAGIFNGSINLGAIASPPLAVWLTLNYGWPAAFVFPALLGFLWLFLWTPVYTSSREHSRPFRQEADPVSWTEGPPVMPAGSRLPDTSSLRLPQLLRSPQVWGLVVSRFLIGPVWSLYVFWLPEYLKSERKMSLVMIGLLAWIPFVISLAGSVAGGEFSGLLIRWRCPVFLSRHVALGVGAVLSATGLWVGLAQSTAVSFILICVAAFGLSFWAANYYAILSDATPTGVIGRVTGLTGVGNGVGGMIFMLATGIVVDRFSYLPIFTLATVLPLAAFFCLICLVRQPIRA